MHADGRVSRIRTQHVDAGSAMTDFTIASVRTANLPSMSPDVARVFGDEPLEVIYDVIIY